MAGHTELPGWTRLPGKERHYQDPTGREVSRRQYEKEVNRQAGIVGSKGEPLSLERAAQIRIERGTPGAGGRMRERDRWIFDEWKREHPHASDADALRATRRLGNVFRENPNAKTRDNSHNGPIAKALAEIGRRKWSDRHNVGETPSLNRALPYATRG